MNTKHSVATLAGSFDAERAAELRRAYEEAVENGKTFFVWQEQDLYVPYVKYLLQYVEGELSETRTR